MSKITRQRERQPTLFLYQPPGRALYIPGDSLYYLILNAGPGVPKWNLDFCYYVAPLPPGYYLDKKNLEVKK